MRSTFDSMAEARKKAFEEAAAADPPADGAAEVSETTPEAKDADFVGGTKRKHRDSLDATQSQDAEPLLSDAPHPTKKQATGSPSEHLPQDL